MLFIAVLYTRFAIYWGRVAISYALRYRDGESALDCMDDFGGGDEVGGEEVGGGEASRAAYASSIGSEYGKSLRQS